jgi:calcium-dependent protein kinase
MQAEINKLEGPIDIGLTRREFSTLLTRSIGRLTLNSNRLFDLFDEDRSGYIDFRELCICFSLLSKGSFEEKLRLCFDLYDLEASGCLRKQELVEVIQAVSLPLYEELEKGYSLSTKQTIDTLYMLLSALADSGLVTWAEFLATIRQNPTLESCFSAYISIQETIKRPNKPEVRTPANLPKATTSCVQCLLA